MEEYIISFLVSILLLVYSDKTKNKTLKNVLIFFALLIPCLLAGLRTETIGTDVQVYVKPIYEAAISSSNYKEFLNVRWWVEWRYMYVHDFEIGFIILLYFTTKVFKSLKIVLFLIHLLIIIPIYKGLNYYKHKCPVWLGMTIFYLMHYNTSLNMMRQWITMSILFYAFTYLSENNTKKYLIGVFISILFHVTGLFGIGVFILYKISNYRYEKSFIIKGKKFIIKNISVLCICLVACLILLNLKLFVNLLNTIGLSKYSGYITGDFRILPTQIILRIPFLFILWINWKEFQESIYSAPFFLTLIALDIFSAQLISVNMYAFRISSYFSEYSILSIPLAIQSTKDKKKRLFCIIILITFMFIYWIYNFATQGRHHTIPYMMS